MTVSAEPQAPEALPPPQGEQQANFAQEAIAVRDHEQEANNYERVKAYLATHPQATDRGIADALTISTSTANKWRKRIERVGRE